LKANREHLPKPTIPVSENILQWAVHRSGRGLGDLERKLPKLSVWLKGTSLLTLPEVENLAKETSTPLGFLFLSEPPVEKLSIPHFRTVGSNIPDLPPSPDLIDTLQLMEQRQSWMRDYLIEQGYSPLGFVHSSHIGDSPEQVAHEIRRTLGLAEMWAAEQPSWTKALDELKVKMEDIGILVFKNGIVGNNTHRKLDVSEFRGFVLIDDLAPLVFVNNADGKAAQMFTLAHELAHIWFGKSAIFDLKELQPASDEIERASNRVAAEFLVPAENLQELWPSIKNDKDRFQKIAYHFKVSKIVGAYRTLNLGLIKNEEFTRFYLEYEQESRDDADRQEPGGNFYNNQMTRIGRRFGEAVIIAAREGHLLYRDAYKLTDLHGDTFEKFAKELGIG